MNFNRTAKYIFQPLSVFLVKKSLPLSVNKSKRSWHWILRVNNLFVCFFVFVFFCLEWRSARFPSMSKLSFTGKNIWGNLTKRSFLARLRINTQKWKKNEANIQPFCSNQPDEKQIKLYYFLARQQSFRTVPHFQVFNE